MEMESLHNDTQAAEPTELGPSSEPASYKDAQIWKDIEAETGFASYTDYLEFYQNIRPDFVDRMEEFKALPSVPIHAALRPSIVIYDLSIQENSTTTISLRCHCHSGTKLLQALREVHEPTGTNCVRLVLWFYPAGSLNQEIIETLVLGLKLGIKFVDDLPNVIWRGTTDSTPFNQRRPTPAENFRTHQISSISGDKTIATILQKDVTNETPVVLVMGTPDYRYDNSLLLERIIAGWEYRTPPVRRLVLEDKNHILRATMSNNLRTPAQDYAEIGEQFLQGQDATPTKAFLLLASMSPLLYVEAYLVSKAFNQLQKVYTIIAEAKVTERLSQPTAPDDRDLNHGRLELRRSLEETEDLLGQIFRYLGSAAQSDYFEEPSYVSIRADLRILIDDARRLEAEVRDYIQDAISHAAWSESRASIELSNLQINEAKRSNPAKSSSQKLTLIIWF